MYLKEVALCLDGSEPISGVGLLAFVDEIGELPVHHRLSKFTKVKAISGYGPKRVVVESLCSIVLISGVMLCNEGRGDFDIIIRHIISLGRHYLVKTMVRSWLQALKFSSFGLFVSILQAEPKSMNLMFPESSTRILVSFISRCNNCLPTRKHIPSIICLQALKHCCWDMLLRA